MYKSDHFSKECSRAARAVRKSSNTCISYMYIDLGLGFRGLQDIALPQVKFWLKAVREN